MFELNSLEQLSGPAQRMLAWLRQDMGLRIGQSTILSQKVHTMDPRRPQEVTVLQHSDAGQIFYQRSQPGQVYHFDIFHQCGLVEHRQVAKAVVKAITLYNFHYGMYNGVILRGKTGEVKADWFDIQTATGGGRITGSLEYGKKLSLRKAHENHVHITGILTPETAACAFYIVQAAESVIMANNRELRANERIIHIFNKTGGYSDLSPYSDQSDSFLQEKNLRHVSPTLKRQQFLQDAVELAEECDTVKDVRDMLNSLEKETGKSLTSGGFGLSGEQERALERLAGMGIIDVTGKRKHLTAYGREFKAFLDHHMPDVESHIRRMYRLFKPYQNKTGQSKQQLEKGGSHTGKRVIHQSVQPAGGEVAIPETVQAAAARLVTEHSCGRIHITCPDIRRYSRQTKRKTEICVLLDASASMAGQRINAAKYLVRHLLLSTPDRVGVITFQENKSCVQVPFTRDYQLVQQSLKEIRACGSTPLGLGIRACLKYMDEAKPQCPLILLVTDGVPTFADTTKDPVADALTAAKQIKEKGYGFTCIGLKPHHDYLTRLTQSAGGNVYIVEELEKQALVRTAWQEHRIR